MTPLLSIVKCEPIQHLMGKLKLQGLTNDAPYYDTYYWESQNQSCDINGQNTAQLT